jgi:hypothetical protein
MIPLRFARSDLRERFCVSDYATLYEIATLYDFATLLFFAAVFDFATPLFSVFDFATISLALYLTYTSRHAHEFPMAKSKLSQICSHLSLLSLAI